MADPQVTKKDDQKIVLSQYTQALLDTFKNAKKSVRPDDISALSVSQTVSFFALVYERVRNAVEYREDHLILRAAIERILRRRFSLNPDGHGEAENLLRELLWARYFDNGVLGAEDNVIIQNLINKYILLRRQLVIGRDNELRIFLDQFLMDLLTCEVEETLKPQSATVQSNLSFFIYQVLRNKIKIEGLNGQEVKSRLFSSDNKYNIDAGENIISVRYTQFFEEHPGIGSHDIVRSGIVNIKTPILQDQQSYRLALINPPQNHDDAKAYAKQPIFGLYNAKNQLLVEQKGGKTQNAGILQNLFSDAPTDLTQKATTVVQPAPVYTSQAVVAKAGIEKQKDLTSSGNAQQLINSWKNASKSERQAFMAWLAEQAQ